MRAQMQVARRPIASGDGTPSIVKELLAYATGRDGEPAANPRGATYVHFSQ